MGRTRGAQIRTVALGMSFSCVTSPSISDSGSDVVMRMICISPTALIEFRKSKSGR